MKVQKLPLNIELLILDSEISKKLISVNSLDIYEGITKNFHPRGLFSTEIFGRVGDPRRDTVFSYIDLGVKIYHPFIYKIITKLKALYGEIMAGKAYAIYDTKLNDFVRSNPIEGETGFNFFYKNFKKIELAKNDSIKRSIYIELIEKYRDKFYMDKLLVLPAGLRDLSLDSSNRQSEDEINKLYRKILGYSALVENINIDLNIEYVNNIRYNIQTVSLEIYTYIKTILEGKKGMIQDKWANRKVFNSTRNVITSYISNLTSINDVRTVTSSQSVIGLYQALKTISPLSMKLIQDEYLHKAFPGSNSPIFLVNKTTLKRELVNFEAKLYDEWMSKDGLEKKFNLYSREDIRHTPIEIKDYYLMLVYISNKGYRVINDIDEIPEPLRKDGVVAPMTYTELYMLSIYKYIKDIPVFITRYPITSYGSIYPSFIYLKSTISSKIVPELDENLEPTGFVCSEYPILGEKFFDSVSVAQKNLARLGADYDGDTVSVTAVLTEEAKEEVRLKLASREYHVDANNRMSFSSESDISKLVLGTLTR